MTWGLLEYTEEVIVAALDQSQVSGLEVDEDTSAVFDEDQAFELLWTNPGARSEMVQQALGGMVELSAEQHALLSDTVESRVRPAKASTWARGVLPPGAI